MSIVPREYLTDVESEWLQQLRTEVIDPIRREVAAHPFLIGAVSGELPIAIVRHYLTGLLWNITAFPECVAALASRTPRYDHATKRLLLENAAAEMDHPFALADTVRYLGGDPDPILHGPEHAYLPPHAWFDHHGLLELYAYKKPWIEGVAAINVGIEAVVPSQIGPLGLALHTKYGVPKEHMAWFHWHGGEVEQEHGNDGLRILERHVAPDDKETQALCGYAVRRIGSMLGHELPDDAMAAPVH